MLQIHSSNVVITWWELDIMDLSTRIPQGHFSCRVSELKISLLINHGLTAFFRVSRFVSNLNIQVADLCSVFLALNFYVPR